jgi:phenylacetate-CoA ligase
VAPAAGGYTCAAITARKQGPVATHLMSDTQIWETVDPDTLAPVPTGRRGLSVATNLVSEASPQLRFLVGDFTVLDSTRCECGRSHPRAVGDSRPRRRHAQRRGVALFPSAVEDAVRRVARARTVRDRVTRERG